jgi:hypothetical protein
MSQAGEQKNSELEGDLVSNRKLGELQEAGTRRLHKYNMKNSKLYSFIHTRPVLFYVLTLLFISGLVIALVILLAIFFLN